MARIRTIKPEFFTDSKIVKLTPLARLFYVSLWCEADKQGRMRWDPDTYKLRYLPGDKVKVSELAEELLTARLIRLYEVDGQVYADIPSFTKNQVINNRESESTLPEFTFDASATRESGVKAEGRKEGKEGKEGTTPIVPKGTDEPEGFKRLMEAYPKRDGTNPRRHALKAYHAAISRGADPDQLVAAAQAYAKTEVAGTRFTQQTSTWLNGDCWRDTPAAKPDSVESPLDLWRRRVSTWAQSPRPPEARWWHHDWGPPPHLPETKVPAEVLKEIGLAA